MGALLIDINTPIWMRLVDLSPARSASTNTEMETLCLLDSVILGGIASVCITVKIKPFTLPEDLQTDY